MLRCTRHSISSSFCNKSSAVCLLIFMTSVSNSPWSGGGISVHDALPVRYLWRLWNHPWGKLTMPPTDWIQTWIPVSMLMKIFPSWTVTFKPSVQLGVYCNSTLKNCQLPRVKRKRRKDLWMCQEQRGLAPGYLTHSYVPIAMISSR